jgi:TPP-dependent pyruvate/acetoin dehydrogenase alpha subunit
LHNLMKKPLIFARCRYGPAVVECHTVRGLDHHGVRDDVAAGCRPLSESKLMEQYCPMKVARRAMAAALADQIDREAAEQVEAAYAAALAAPPAAAEVPRG